MYNRKDKKRKKKNEDIPRAAHWFTFTNGEPNDILHACHMSVNIVIVSMLHFEIVISVPIIPRSCWLHVTLRIFWVVLVVPGLKVQLLQVSIP